MRAASKLVTVMLTTSLIATTPAYAKDLCLNLDGFTFVGKGVAIPGKGKCKPWGGFVESTCNFGLNHASSTGTICRASDDSHVDVLITSACYDGTGVFVNVAVLPFPSLTGGTNVAYTPDTGGGGGVLPGGAAAFSCFPNPVPVP